MCLPNPHVKNTIKSMTYAIQVPTAYAITMHHSACGIFTSKSLSIYCLANISIFTSLRTRTQHRSAVQIREERHVLVQKNEYHTFYLGIPTKIYEGDVAIAFCFSFSCSCSSSYRICKSQNRGYRKGKRRLTRLAHE
jgi:hypothetical protein